MRIDFENKYKFLAWLPQVNKKGAIKYKVKYIADAIINASSKIDVSSEMWMQFSDKITGREYYNKNKIWKPENIDSIIITSTGGYIIRLAHLVEPRGTRSMDLYVLYAEKFNINSDESEFIAETKYIVTKYYNSITGEVHGYEWSNCDYIFKSIREDPDLEAAIKILMFIEFTKIETKIVNLEYKDWQSNKLAGTENEIEIQIIDSLWFTNIERTTGFNVNGHFRFQPIGEGRKDNKLIWINSFQKNGYKRIAGKLKAENDL